MLRFYGTYARRVTEDGQFAGAAPVLALGNVLLWQGFNRTHDCEACAASGVSELLYTTGLLALVPVQHSDEGFSFEFEATEATAARMNLLGPVPAAPAAVIEWQHDHRCATPTMSDADLIARARASAALSGGHCRRARIPNCELARLLDMVREEKRRPR